MVTFMFCLGCREMEVELILSFYPTLRSAHAELFLNPSENWGHSVTNSPEIWRKTDASQRDKMPVLSFLQQILLGRSKNSAETFNKFLKTEYRLLREYRETPGATEKNLVTDKTTSQIFLSDHKKHQGKQELWESIIHSADLREGNSSHQGEDTTSCLILLPYLSHGSKAGSC